MNGESRTTIEEQRQLLVDAGVDSHNLTDEQLTRALERLALEAIYEP